MRLFCIFFSVRLKEVLKYSKSFFCYIRQSTDFFKRQIIGEYFICSNLVFFIRIFQYFSVKWSDTCNADQHRVKVDFDFCLQVFTFRQQLSIETSDVEKLSHVIRTLKDAQYLMLSAACFLYMKKRTLRTIIKFFH